MAAFLVLESTDRQTWECSSIPHRTCEERGSSPWGSDPWLGKPCCSCSRGDRQQGCSKMGNGCLLEEEKHTHHSSCLGIRHLNLCCRDLGYQHREVRPSRQGTEGRSHSPWSVGRSMKLAKEHRRLGRELASLQWQEEFEGLDHRPTYGVQVGKPGSCRWWHQSCENS